uniref:Uncharacterized protein n=1 Tax=Bacillus subtilis TaxID=1423 RepID=A0A1J0AL00_BACIU|nr:hypothetical protein pBS72_1370 [Bacillus subtilis]
MLVLRSIDGFIKALDESFSAKIQLQNHLEFTASNVSPESFVYSKYRVTKLKIFLSSC